MKRNKYNDYLWYITLVVFIISLMEGLVYYNDKSLFIRIILSVQNVAKVYTIDTNISLEEVIENIHSSNVLIVILTYLYCISVIIAPLCALGVLATLVRKPSNYIKGILTNKNKKKVLLVGSGKYKTEFVKSLVKDCKLSIIEDYNALEVNKLEYLDKGIKVVPQYADMSINDIISILNINKFDDILLCSDNIIDNIDVLKVIVDKHNNGSLLSTSDYQKIHLCCKDNLLNELIRQYSDKIESKRLEINIVDINKITVDKLFKNYPIYLGNKEENDDVHLGIIGFGDFGQKTLIQGLNMAVLSDDSKIYVDVFDKNIKSIIGHFMKNFSVDLLSGLKHIKKNGIDDEDCSYYELNFLDEAVAAQFAIDGEVRIRFFEVDVNSILFNKVIKKCNEDFEFTYIVIAIGDKYTIANTILDLKHIICKKGNDCITIPVVTRVVEDSAIVSLYDEKCLFTMDQNNDIYSYKTLLNQDTVNEAMLFNYRYNLLYDGNKDFKEIDYIEMTKKWNSMSMFDRESSISQSLHQQIKRWFILEKRRYSFEQKELLEKIEHRRWNIFMITHGFKYKKSAKKDLIAKTHPCILKWEDLKRERPDTLEYDYTPYVMLKLHENM